jgi:oligopeptide transport system substrate-binding protein
MTRGGRGGLARARIRRIRVWAAVALLAAACRPLGGEPPPGELRINLGTEPPSLDWALATDGTSFLLLEQLMRGLTRMGPDLRPQPALAERWEVSDDGLVWTFHLRRDVVWSDGVPLEAEQFVRGWRRLLSPQTAAEYAYFLYPVKNARAFNAGEIDDPSLVGVRARDRHTLEVELEAPLVYFPSLTTFMVTFPGRLDLVERYGVDWTEPEHFETLGAFVLEEWRHEYKIVLRANPKYYGPPPSLERVTGYMVDMDSTALVLFEQGLIDIVRLPALEIRRFRGRPEYRTLPLLRGYYYGFNTKLPPFDDVRVRRALAHAIDRREFPKVLQGGELPSGSWLPPAEAGVDASTLPPVRIVYNTDQTHKLVAESVQAQWRENLGLAVELENREWKVFLKELVSRPPPVYRLGWGADFPDPDNFMNLFTSTSANNHTGWSDARYDRLVAEASRELDPARRQVLYDRAQRILCEEEVPIVPFFVTSLNLAVAPRVQGFEPNAMDIYFLDSVSVR